MKIDLLRTKPRLLDSLNIPEEKNQKRRNEFDGCSIGRVTVIPSVQSASYSASIMYYFASYIACVKESRVYVFELFCNCLAHEENRPLQTRVVSRCLKKASQRKVSPKQSLYMHIIVHIYMYLSIYLYIYILPLYIYKKRIIHAFDRIKSSHVLFIYIYNTAPRPPHLFRSLYKKIALRFKGEKSATQRDKKKRKNDMTIKR